MPLLGHTCDLGGDPIPLMKGLRSTFMQTIVVGPLCDFFIGTLISLHLFITFMIHRSIMKPSDVHKTVHQL